VALVGFACRKYASALADHPFHGLRFATGTETGPHLCRDRRQRLDNALQLTEALLRQHPNYRLANLIKGDLLLAKNQPIQTFGALSGAPADKVADLRAEAIVRLKAYRDKPPADFVPRYLLQMQPDQRYAIVVDTKRSRLYLYENDRSQAADRAFVADYYVTQGKLGADKFVEGDKKTPVGVYHVTANLPSQKLADLYGSGAFRSTTRTNGTSARDAMAAASGCTARRPTPFRPPAARLRRLRGADQPGSRRGRQEPAGRPDTGHHQPVGRVAVARRLVKERNELNKTIENLARRLGKPRHRPLPEPLLEALQGRRPEFQEFAAQKKQVNASKEWIKVKVDNLSVFRNPGKEEVVVVTFEQDYRSNNLDNQMKKRQYWLREDGQWKIIYEGSA
jgi:hypothetical protein